MNTMEKSKKANKIRTKLLLKASSEVSDFKKSNMLINSISPKILYDKYNDIEIIIRNPYEFSTVTRKENQKKFNESIISKNENINDSPYMEVFRKINKLLISEKKNKTFFDKLDIKEYKSSYDTSDTTFSSNLEKKNIKFLNENNEENLTNQSIKFLREKARELIYKRIKPKKKPHSFYQNAQFKSQFDLRPCYKKHDSVLPISSKTMKIFEQTIFESSPVIYSSGIEEINHSGISYYKNDCCQSTRNLNKNKKSKISFNLSTYNHEKERSKFLPKKDNYNNNTNNINTFICASIN
jgi:hypothetical protein